VPDRLRAALLTLLVVAVSVPFAAGHLLPQRGFLLLGLAAFAGYSPYAVVLVAVGCLVVRRWRTAAVVGAVALAQGLVLAPAYVPDRTPAGERLVVMTSNLYFGRASAADVVRAVREHRVDVLGVEELTPAAVEGLRAAGLERLLPYSVLEAAPTSTGAGLWSRHPVQRLEPWSSSFRSAAAEVVVGGEHVVVRVLHPPPPGRSDAPTWERNYDGFVAAAGREQTALPELLIGDFNASVHHRRLRDLMGRRWRDAGEVAGSGLVRTWGPWLDRLHVLDPDHVLVDRGVGVGDHETVHVAGSDHLAVVTEVVLPTRR
jgi:endonuclease/exonuclease/phosphatase (EEP) superfamily protein YafD